MKILSIGNSFSQDAQKWLHQIAAADGCELTCVDLFIGGCSLQRHWENIENDAQDYDWELNGGMPLKKCSIREALEQDAWDVITIQQASHYSGQPQTYLPYLMQIVDFLHRNAPLAKLYIHQTWAYEQDSDHWAFPVYSCNQAEMFHRVTDAYEMASKLADAPLLRVGELIQQIRTLPEFSDEGQSRRITRDGFHLSLDYGRWAAAALWYATLTGAKVSENSFVPVVDGTAADQVLLHKIGCLADALAAEGGRA